MSIVSRYFQKNQRRTSKKAHKRCQNLSVEEKEEEALIWSKMI